MAAGRRLARRVAWFQAVATLLLAAALLILSVGHALGGLVGGGALLLGNLFLARLGLARDAPAASEAMGGLIGGLVGKWVVVGAVLLLGIGVFRLPPAAVIAGLFVSMVAFLVAAGSAKQKQH